MSAISISTLLQQNRVARCAPSFADYAEPLADWTADRLVVRTDAWGGYRHDGQLTMRGELTHALLKRHYRGRSAGHIIGLHAAGTDNQCKVGTLDIDQHGDDSQRAEANQRAALHWFKVLTDLGFSPLLTASNGKGGYHLRVLLASAIDAGRVYHFLRWLTKDHQKVGLERPPEQFPKQADVRKCAKGLGNWIRLPGRHHKRDYWSEVWDGRRWLAGHEAVSYILCLDGDDPKLLPESPLVPERKVLRVPRPPMPGRTERRIEKYMQCLPNLSEGQGRDDVAFTFAAFLVRDLAQTDDVALTWMEAWDSRNNPPKGRKRLSVIIHNARLYGQHDVGCSL